MSLYELPQLHIDPPAKKQGASRLKGCARTFKRLRKKHKALKGTLGIILLASVFGFTAGLFATGFAQEELGLYAREYFKPILPQAVKERVIEKTIVEKAYVPQTTEEEKIIQVVQEVSPSVVSIIVTKDVPVFEQYFGESFQVQLRQKGTEKREIGGGTGFIVSEDGMVLTNKHVVRDEEADFTVFTVDGESYPATVLARDPFQDLAVLQINRENVVDENGNFTKQKFSAATLGNSDQVQIGQTAIAIGNALGEFRNTVSVGVISGLGRTITAQGGGFIETIEDVIQTDAAINRGNSGGPLLNLAGEVIGINTATVTEAQSIGFAIPVNRAKRDVQQVQETGEIVYPFLGVRYVLVNREVQEKYDLSVSYGALVLRGEGGEPAVTPGSAAAEAGLKEMDVILEMNGERIGQEQSLAKLIQKRDPGEEVVLRILRNGEEQILTAKLGEMSG